MNIKEEIENIATRYRNKLNLQIQKRIEEMQDDDNSHHLIYRVLGVSITEGEKIDIYQNKGRFLYKYAGSFLEEVTLLCFKQQYPEARKMRIENTISAKPKQFEIDCLVEQDAIEIKWRDATTDGDHITKEHTRLKAIIAKGFRPIRLMFYKPNRQQALKIQDVLKTTYKGLDGLYFSEQEAWNYIRERTGVHLLQILEDLAGEQNGIQ